MAKPPVRRCGANLLHANYLKFFIMARHGGNRRVLLFLNRFCMIVLVVILVEKTGF
jgi:hypothetical protein